jgi:hypothetical protein
MLVVVGLQRSGNVIHYCCQNMLTKKLEINYSHFTTATATTTTTTTRQLISRNKIKKCL